MSFGTLYIDMRLFGVVCSTKIGENSDISKCFEDNVSQELRFLKRFYPLELRKYKKNLYPLKASNCGTVITPLLIVSSPSRCKALSIRETFRRL